MNTQVKTILFTFSLVFFVTGLGCSHQPCKIEDRTDKVMPTDTKTSSDAKDLTTKVFVYKPDGSLQCGQGLKIDLNEMKKELGEIVVYSAENKHDGLMRIQLCGHPTGTCNVYQIESKDLDQALKLGFKKWIRD